MNNKMIRAKKRSSHIGKYQGKAFGGLTAITLCLDAVFGTSGTAFASSTLDATEITDKIWELTAILVSVVQIVGVIVVLWGVVQLALSIQGHDPSQRSQAILMIAGGLLIILGPRILWALGVSVPGWNFYGGGGSAGGAGGPIYVSP